MKRQLIMKRILTFLFVICYSLLNGQAITQVKTFGTTASEYTSTIFTNGNGEIYLVGAFAGAADFDPGPSSTNTQTVASGHDIYLAKYDSSGNFLWVRTWGAAASISHLDAYSLVTTNNEVIVGFYTSTTSLDLDPGTGVVTTFSAAGTAVFVKVDNDGNYIWGKRTASSGVIKGLVIDENDQFYLSGTFQGTADFSPGSGTSSLTSSGGEDVFIAKYDTSGALIWVKKIGGSGNETLTTLHMDRNNNLFLAGRFNSNTLDLNPGSGVNNVNHTSNFDSYLCKLDSSGAHRWSGALSGLSTEFIDAIATSANGDVYFGGTYFGQVDVDMGSGVQNISTPGLSDDMFLVKLDSAGVFQYVKVMGGVYNDAILDIVIDSTNTVYVAGSYNGTVDFDPSSNGVYELVSTSGDGFIATYTPSGNFQMVRQIGNGTGNTFVRKMFVRDDYVYACGQYNLFMYIYTSTGYTGFSGQGTDCYFFRMTTCATVLTASVSLVPDTVYGCSGDSVSITAVPVNGGITNTYQWRLNGNIVNGVFGSLYTGPLNAGNTLTCVLKSTEGCVINPITPEMPVVNNFTTFLTPSHFISTNPGIICNGVVVTFSSVATNGGSNPGYQWYQNNILVPGATQSTFSPSVYAHNDNIACTLFPNSCTSLDSVSVNTFITVFQVPNATVNVNGNVLSAQTAGATYQWVDCNNNYAPIPNAIQQAFSPISNGSYALIISNPFCSDTSACQTITTIGMNDQDLLEQSIRILPNPTSDNTLVTFPDFIEVTSIIITDMAGRNFGYTLVLGNEKRVELSVGHLSPGIYILQLNHSTGVISKQLIVE
jgi:Secretion system C-terminal sorting domain